RIAFLWGGGVMSLSWNPRRGSAWKKSDSFTRISVRSATSTWKSSCFSVPLTPKRPSASSGLGGAAPALRKSASSPFTTRSCSGLRRIACEARRTWSRSLRTVPSVSSAPRSWAKTRSWACPARLRSSSREIPGRSAFARWRASSRARVWARNRSLASRWRYHSRSTATTCPAPWSLSSSSRSCSGPKGLPARGAAARQCPEPAGGPRAEAPPPHPRRARLLQMLLQHLRGVAGGEEAQMLGERGALSLEARWGNVEDAAAPDGDDRRVGAHREAVAGQRHQRALEPEARATGLAGLELGSIHPAHPGHHLLGTGVEAHAIADLDRAGRILQLLERPVQQQGGNQRA